jgi:uncharacterized LabA/DUF88 family protein
MVALQWQPVQCAQMVQNSSSSSSGGATGRHIALLIDADNVSHSKIAGILSELSKYGTPNVRRAYGDWASKQLAGWTSKLHQYAIRPIQQFAHSKGKNASDISLVIDAMELHYTQRLDGFAIASSDADFTPLVMHLRAAGHEVYGFGERKTPEPFVNACTTFLYLDTLGAETAESEPAPPRAVAVAPAAKATSVAPKAKSTPAQDAKLVATLRLAVEAVAREDGWAMLATAGSAAKRQAPIDPRNYGVKNFPALFEATGLFDIVKGPDGQAFVADKRNKDRSPKPVD